MLKCSGKLSGKFYLVSLILVVLLFVMTGCGSSPVGDIGSDDGIVTDGDLEGAKLFAQNLSDHSINLMELGTDQIGNIEEGMFEQVGPYAEATFYRMVWIGEILDMWDEKMEEPGVYIADFNGGDVIYTKESSVIATEVNGIQEWTFIIKNFYDDLNGDHGVDESVYHKVTITGYPEDHYDFIDKNEIPYKRYINLAEAEFNYEHKRFIGDKGLSDQELLADQGVEDTSFNWSFDFSLNSDNTEEVYLYTEENFYFDDPEDIETEYYYILPINPGYSLEGTLDDELLIDDNSGDVQVGELNNDDVTPPYLGSITVNSNLVTDSDNKKMTIDGNITAEHEGRQTVEFNGEASVNYNDYIFEDENVVIDLIDFSADSYFRVNEYFEIKGGLDIQFSELKMQPENYFSLSVPEKIELNGSYEDLSEVNGMVLSGDITVEFINIDEYDFEAEDSADNFAQVRVAVNGELSSEYDPVVLEIVLERTGLEEIAIDPLNYSFFDGSSMEGNGLINPDKLELTARCNSNVLIYLDLEFSEVSSENYLLGGVRDEANNIIADIIFDNHEMVFEFTDGESIAMFPADDIQ